MYINMALLAAKTVIGATGLAATTGKKLIEVSIPAAKKHP